MFATAQTQQMVYDLQVQDIEARKIKHEAESLEETARLEQIIERRKEIVVERHQLEEQKKREQVAVNGFEAQLAQLRTQAGTIDVKLRAAGVTPKEVIALTKQQESIQAKTATLEDAQMEYLDKIEQLEREDAILASNDLKLHEAGLDVKNRRDIKLAELKKRMRAVNSRRKVAVEALPPDVLEVYRRFAALEQGNVVLRYTGGKVIGSHTELTVAQLQQIESAPAEEMVVLEDEGLLVVRA